MKILHLFVKRAKFIPMILAALVLLPSAAIVQSDLESERIDLSLNEATLEQAFAEIEKQSGIKFVYGEAVNKYASTRVDIVSNDISLEEALTRTLKGTNLGYTLRDDYILINENPVQQPLPTPQAQQSRISGKVTNAAGEPVSGAMVIVQGRQTGEISNAEGTFTVDANQGDVLQVSLFGYVTRNIVVGNERSLTITLDEDMTLIEDVVVVGYGVQKKINLTGAVDAVTSEAFENRSVSNVTQALQGVVPNLNINLSDGKASRTASFNVRGETSIGQGGSALVLIDGVESDPIFLNPNDIESVSVLKDAASAAIYGARGSFGVVLITTKNATEGRVSVNYTGNFSLQQLAREPEFVTDAVTWLEHFRASYFNGQGTLPTSINNNTQYYSDEWLERMRAWKASGAGDKTEILPNGDYEYYTNTDWMGMLFKDHSFVQDHNVTVSGGDERSNFYLSGRFYNNDGMYNFDPDTYRSYNLRGKASYKLFKWLKVFNNSEYSNNFYHQPYSAQGRGANIQRYIEVNAFPSLPMYNPDGTYTRGGAATLGAFADGNNYQDNGRNLFKNMMGLNAGFFDNTLRVNADFTFRYDDRDFMWKRTKTAYYQNANAVNPSYMGDQNGTIYEWLGKTMYTASNIYAEYEKTFAEKHWLKAMAGWNYETSKYKAMSVQRNQLLMTNAESGQLATGTTTAGYSVTNWRTVGTFFRLNYGYDDRYLIEVNGRYDGSSRFPTNQQWGFFPSVSAAWRLSEEHFWNVNKKIISDVKFRASYGSLGNGSIGAYQFLETLAISTSGRVLNGALNKRTSAAEPIPDGLTWETATTTDIGLDMGLLNGRMRFTGDYYVRKTTDMYVAGPTLPEIFGAAAPKGNYADMTTRGFELALSWNDQFKLGGKPFRYEIRAALYDYVSTIDKFNNPTKIFTQHYEGQTIGELWGFKTVGLFDHDPTPEEYVNTLFRAHADNTWRRGDLQIANLDGSTDNMITKGSQTVDDPGDMTIIGNTSPRYQYSFNLSAEWNGIFFSAFLQGVGRRHWYPGSETAFWGQYNRGYNQIPAWHLGNYWTEDNTDAYLPRYSQYNGTLGYSNYVPNDRYLQKISYLRLRNLQIGYTLPSHLTSKIGISNARVYLSGENLASWSPLYKIAKNFMDVSSAVADRDNDLDSGYNQGAGNSYPMLRTFSLGISITY
jgi:TonB-linked SusC/RagA family outer membrane protein